MRVNQNIPALASYNAVQATQANLAKAVGRLSTGLRINSAADDAAGLAISEKMRAQVRGLDQASSNAQDGISMLQTAEGALSEVHSSLQRMRELSVQAANDTLTQEDREYIQLEIESIREEIDRISKTTQFNKKKLLDGSSDTLWSTDRLGTWLNVKGSTAAVDQFGQAMETEGNYKVSVTAAEAGRNQVLKSNIMMLADEDSTVAGKNVKLNDLANFIDANGVSLVGLPQTLTISFEDGGSASFTLYGQDTIGQMGEKFTAAVRQASGVPQEGSPVQFVGEEFVMPSENDPVAKWLEASAKRIQEQYGLVGNGGTLTIDYSTESPWATMFVRNTSDGAFLGMNPEHVNPSSTEEMLSSTTAHEMVHAVLGANPNIARAVDASDGSGMWLLEGLTEYIAPGNGRVAGVYQSQGAGGYEAYIVGKIDKLFNATTSRDEYIDWTDDTPDLDAAYTASYLATRYFDEKSLANGGTGIKGLLKELNEGAAMDDAVKSASNGLFEGVRNITGSGNDLEDKLKADTDWLKAVGMEDPNKDAGAIGGYYASGGSELPSGHVVGASSPRANPLSEYGWEKVVWPSGEMDESEIDTLSFSAAKAGTLQSVEGTLLIHSTIAGKAGRMTLSGDERVLAALGFAEVQAAADTTYRATVSDAHSGFVLAADMKFVGSSISGAINNIDINFGTNFALGVDGEDTQADGYGTYKFTAEHDDFTVHVASRATVLQIGANEKEDMVVNFGDTGAKALGIDKVSTLSRELAVRSITIIDRAVSDVSQKRARLGAYQNRLEHTVNNLTTASTNLTASESRIRDTDMSKAMMDFTKLNLLTQSSLSMMSQANQLPQAVLGLMR